MGKKEIFLIYLDEWGSWLLLTFVLSLLLIFLSLFISSHSAVFSDFLSYCFTLTAVTFYLFDHHVETTVDVKVPRIRKTLNLTVLASIAIFYSCLNTSNAVQSFLESNFATMSIVISLVVFGLTAWLMYPLIKRQVELTKGRREREIQEREKQKFLRMRTIV